DHLGERILQDFQSVRQHLGHTTAKYTDQYHRLKGFPVGDLVMVHLHKERFPTGAYHKLQSQKFGPNSVKKHLFDYFPPDEVPTLPELTESSSLQLKES
ncbi:hypothetical protein TorRG33x02_064810, partial [Trema orientale]